MEPREQVQSVQDRIDHLNSQKSGLDRAWKGEKERLNDPDMPQPPELKGMNTSLFHLYTKRDDLLKSHPELQNEFGTPGRKKNRNKSFHVCQSTITAADRRRRKLKIHTGFKAWCSDQRPQIKFSLENWEDTDIQNRYILEQVVHPNFKSFCGRTASPFAFTVSNWKNEKVRARFEEWKTASELRQRLERKRQEEEAVAKQARAKAEEAAKKEIHFQKRMALIPPNFPEFAQAEGGIDMNDRSAILLLWDTDEDARELFYLWFEERLLSKTKTA